MADLPVLTQFRLEIGNNGVAHLVFDCPGRTMNVFSNAAIEELGRIGDWLPEADVQGLVIRSGKANAFCAGADLTELGVAYDEIMATPRHARFNFAAAHFFRLSLALRAIETAGKPVAAAIAGLALGGGCEFTLAAHHRVLVDDPRAAMGLPESLVGLFPGAGGTQRLPRLIGLEASLPILLDGAQLSGGEALGSGLVDELCAAGEEVARAEAWILGNADAIQPWDRDDYVPLPAVDVATTIASVRREVLRTTLGHYPAPLAILDCLESGLPQTFDGAIRSDSAIFAHLIQREEPRNMIRTLFLAKTEYERLSRRGDVPEALPRALATATTVVDRCRDMAGLAQAGFFHASQAAVRTRSRSGLWLDREAAASVVAAVETISKALVDAAADLDDTQHRLFDYLAVSSLGYPAYLGGPFAYSSRPER